MLHLSFIVSHTYLQIVSAMLTELMQDQMYVQNHINQMAHASINLVVNMAIKMMIVGHVTLKKDMEKMKMETAIFALIHSL